MNYNHVTLLGRIVDTPKLVNFGNDSKVANFSLAVNRKYKDKEEVSFIDCQAFGAISETIEKYFTKGKPILVDGRLKQSTWEKDGNKMSKLSVIVENFTFINDGEKKQNEGSSNSVSVPKNAPSNSPNAKTPYKGKGNTNAMNNVNNDDIPF